VDSRTHSSNRHFCCICNLLIGEAHNVTKDNRFSEFIRKLKKRSLYVIGKTNRRKNLIRRRRCPESNMVALWQRNGWASLLLAHTVEKRVAGDPPEPTLKGPGGIGREPFSYFEEDFLNEVGGVIRIASETVRERVDLAPVAVRNIFPGNRRILGHGPHLVRYNAANAM
jgi:hypothetical protein